MDTSTEHDVKQLNSFLRGELSAVETYQQCIEKMDNEVVISQLEILKDSHRSRSIMLKEKITALGGKPEPTSGIWGAFAKVVEGSATALGASVAISMLEEGEGHGKEAYQGNLEKLSPSQRGFIQSVIYPEQQKSHDILHALEAKVKAGA